MRKERFEKEWLRMKEDGYKKLEGGGGRVDEEERWDLKEGGWRRKNLGRGRIEEEREKMEVRKGRGER